MSKLSFEFKCIFYFLTLGLFCGHLTCSCERRPRPHRDDDEFVDVTVACDENSQIQAHTPYRLRNLILWRSALLPLTSVAKRTFWQEPFWKSGSSSISGADKKQTLSVALVLPCILGRFQALSVPVSSYEITNAVRLLALRPLPNNNWNFLFHSSLTSNSSTRKKSKLIILN